jgi:hypothetical protein
MTGTYVQQGWTIIVGGQVAPGILSYVKLFELSNKTDLKALNTAAMLADYMVNFTNTYNLGAWANFTRSTVLSSSL